MKKPEQVLFFDFETYYSQKNKYSLSSMTTLDYIMDKRFQPICLAAQVNNQEGQVVAGDGSTAPKQMREMLMDLGWEKSLVVAHHNRFDASICRFRLKMPKPRMFGCTRLMARAVVRPFVSNVTLARVAEYYKRGQKGEQRERYVEYHLEDFSDAQLMDYMRYCQQDTALCAGIFQDMYNQPFPRMELANIDIVLQMFLYPQFQLNTQVLSEHLQAVRDRKQQLLDNLPEGVTETELQSAPKLTQVLESLGAEVPLKWSDKQQKEIPALAKTDEGFKELQENGSPDVQAVCAARLRVKSTIEETRTERLLYISKRYKWLCVPLVYAGAHTIRYSGDEKINMQNPPRGSRIREAMIAPPGYEVTSADLAQIEARIAATLANCTSLIEAFRNPKRDPYCEAAENVFGRKITKRDDPKERFAGKTMILQLQYGSGWKKLQTMLARGEDGRNAVHIPDNRAKDMVYGYRRKYSEIPNLWSQYEAAMVQMVQKKSFDLPGGCSILLGMLCLPNGILMPYHKLERGRNGYTYMFGRERRYLYGAKMLENVTQALAALLVREAMVRLYWRDPRLRVHLQVHDDVTIVHKKCDRQFVYDALYEELTKVPKWLPNLPLEVEINTGANYLEVH